MATDVHLLYNSRSRRGKACLPDIVDELSRHQLKPAKIHDISQQSVQKIIKGLTSPGRTLVIVAGGDGTVSTLLGQLIHSQVEIGIIPLGTTNNFARSLGLPLTIPGAIQTLATASAQPVDLGEVNGEYFANVMGVGLSAQVAQKADGKHKKLLGRVAYAFTALSVLVKHRAFVVTVSDPDGKLVSSYETHQLIIANGRYHAGRQIAADAHVDSRELVIFPLGRRRWWSLLWHTLDFYVGRRQKIVHSPYLTAQEVVITTSRKQPFEIDGEARPAAKTFKVAVTPRAVQVRFDP